MTHQHETSVSDAKLIERCLEGDQAAYGQIVERYQTLVCSVAYSRCGDPALSEDIAQEAFLAAWMKLADLRDGTRLKAWLCTIARNLAGRAAKREQRTVTRPAAQLDAASAISTRRESESQLASTEENELVWKALQAMPEEYREPLVLFYREEQSVAVVAEALDLSVDAVKQRLSRGRRMLHEQVAAAIESSLARSKPSAAFTLAVLGAISAPAAAEAAAVGISTSGVSTGAVAAAKAGTAAIAAPPVLAAAGQLAVLGWLGAKVRSEYRLAGAEERHLLNRFFIINGVILFVFCVTVFSSIWWQAYLPDAWPRWATIPGLLVLAYIPLLVTSARYSKDILRVRRTGPAHRDADYLPARTEPRVLSTSETVAFVNSGFLVGVWPVLLALRAADWPAIAGILGITTASCLASFGFARRFPRQALQIIGAHLTLVALLGVGIVWWQRETWCPGLEGLSSLFVVFSGIGCTNVVLASLLWKRIWGRPVNQPTGPQR